jgi:hypothetical protein
VISDPIILEMRSRSRRERAMDMVYIWVPWRLRRFVHRHLHAKEIELANETLKVRILSMQLHQMAS